MQTTPPTPEVGAFRQALRHDLTLARQQQSLRRWKNACVLTGAAAVILAAAVGLLVLDPQVAGNLHATLGGSAAVPAAATPDVAPVGAETLLARQEINARSDREFLEAFYASGGREPVEVRSLTSERLLAVREFTLSDGKQMTVYTQLGDSEPTDPFTVARPATLTF